MTLLLYGIVIALTVGLCRYIQWDINNYTTLFIGRLSFKFNKNVFTIIFTCLPLFLLLSLRYDVGSDYFNYERIFNDVLHGGSYNEIGFDYLIKIIGGLFNSYQVFLSVLSIITVYLFIKWVVLETSDHEISLPISVFIIITFFLGPWCNNVREVIAIGIVLFSYRDIKNNSFKKFILKILLASLFHTSAFVIIPLYFFINGKKIESVIEQRRRIKLSIIASITIYIIYLKYAENYEILYANYITRDIDGGRIRDFLLFNVLFYIPEMYNCKNVLAKNNSNLMYYILIVFELVLFIATWKIAYAFRLAYYFSIGHAIIIPTTIKVQSSYKTRSLLQVYYIIVLIFYTWYMHGFHTFDGISEYHSVL